MPSKNSENKYFSGNYRVKFGHFVNFSYVIFWQNVYPPTLTELLWCALSASLLLEIFVGLSIAVYYQSIN